MGAPAVCGVMLGTWHLLDGAEHRVDIQPTTDASEEREHDQDRDPDDYPFGPPAALGGMVHGPAALVELVLRFHWHVKGGYLPSR